MKKILSKILVSLGTIASDKLLHFICGMIAAALIAPFRILAPYAFIMGVMAGIGKELYDKKKGGKIDWHDMAATVIGALVLQIFVWLYLLFW